MAARSVSPNPYANETWAVSDNQITNWQDPFQRPATKKNQSKGCGSGEWCDDNNRQHNMEIDFLSTKTSLKIIVIQ